MASCVDNPRTRTKAKSNDDSDRSHGENSASIEMELDLPGIHNLASCIDLNKNQEKQNETCRILIAESEEERKEDEIWMELKEEASIGVQEEPVLSDYYSSSILSHNSLESALANQLSVKLSSSSVPKNTLFDLFLGVLEEDEEVMAAVKDDLRAVKEADPECTSYVHCFLNLKGFLACQAHRVAHKLWLQGRKALAGLIQSRVSEVFAVDIHPGAQIGRGTVLDHATGVVMGGTVVLGNNVTISHNVTLGGTGKDYGDRHPKIGDGVLIGPWTKVLGNVRIAEDAKIEAGSVVLNEVPPRATAGGNPARLICGNGNPVRLDHMHSSTRIDQTSRMVE